MFDFFWLNKKKKMFFALFAFSLSYEYTLNAVARTGEKYALAKFTLDMTTKSVHPEILETEKFKSTDIEFLEIPLEDGASLKTPSVGALQDLRISLYVTSDNEPTAFTITQSRRRNERNVAVKIVKPSVIGLPQAPELPKKQEQGGLFGGSALSSVLPFLLIFCLCQNLAASKMQGGAGGGGGN